MDNRLKLHDLLLSIGGPNVYYQLPSNITMKYPAIKYELNKIENTHANNSTYTQNKSYTITVLSTIVDDTITDKISKLPKCRFDRRYSQDGIYHNVFNIYY